MSQHTKQSFPLIVGHRGAAGHAPENTLVSLSYAKQLGATWVEFDTMMLKDEEIILMHDVTLTRTTGKKEFVRDCGYEEVELLDAGRWFAKAFKGEKIPTFSQYLKALTHLEMNYIVELKNNGSPGHVFVDRVLSLVTPYWDPKRSHPIFFSEEPSFLKQVRNTLPGAKLGQVMHHWNEGVYSQFLKDDFSIACVNHKEFPRERVKELNELKKEIAVYTVNDPLLFWDWGHEPIHYLITDYPSLQPLLYKERPYDNQ